jgi:AcrR family transcriptional regulator
MSEKSYHHGDLRNALIEAGIELVNARGVEQFSLRKVAAICGVSHTAPYAHFKDMNALMAAMSEHVTTQFMEKLQTTADNQSDTGEVITELGKAYISFFAEHPNYYQFLFFHSGVAVDLDHDDSDGYPPFALFRNTVYQILDFLGVPHEAKKQTLITMWALVHGITALLTNKSIQYSGDWNSIMDNVKGKLL